MTDEPEAILFYSRKAGYGWLSNFWRSPFVMRIDPFDSKEDRGGVFAFPTNEHFYQSQKATDTFTRRWIASAPTPFAAMLAGRSLRPHEFRQDWERVKVNVMLTGLRKKFTLGSDLGDLLLGTGDAKIHEDSPTDEFWGWRGCERCGGPHKPGVVDAYMHFPAKPGYGKDMLGKCLMSVRAELRTDLENQR